MIKTASKISSVILCIAISVLIITFSIGLPIYFRPFYYLQMDDLGVMEDTGFDNQTVREAYDELLDYLTIPGREFSTGVFAFSEEGADHFADCRMLFNINITAFLISAIAVAVILILAKKRLITLLSVRGYGIPFVSGIVTLSLSALLGLIVAVDFEGAFLVFHSIFFPGKYNWIIDPRTDGIINALPLTFFMRCAVLICVSIVLISVLLILFGVRRQRRTLLMKDSE